MFEKYIEDQYECEHEKVVPDPERPDLRYCTNCHRIVRIVVKK